MRKLTSVFFLFLVAVTLLAQKQTTLYQKTDEKSMLSWVDSVYNSLSVDERVGQLFMPIVESNSSWKSRIAGYINNQKIGGVLFSKGTLAQQAEMTNYVQSIAKTPLFVSLDGEWGLSMRLTDAPKFPRNMIMGAIRDEETLRQYGREVARQCREMGIHINFAPSIDVHSNPANPVIGSRSFGEDPNNVAKQGIAYARGLEDNGVMAVGKHFPGHGDTSEDSHKTLPIVNHSINRLNSVELLPFRQFIEAGISGIMLGHLNVPALNTNGMPASLSPNNGQKLLKEQFGFTGLTFTDGMAMKGVSTQPDMSVKALLAGNDIILGVINQEKEFDAVKQAVEKGIISDKMLEEKVKKILSYKYILNVPNFKPINIRTLSSIMNTSECEWTQRKIYDKAVTLVKNNDSVLPVTSLDKKRIASVAVGVSSRSVFQKWLRKYAQVTDFQVATTDRLADISGKLNNFDLVIVSIHSSKAKDSKALQQLATKMATVLVVFDSPYSLNSLRGSTAAAKSVVMAYDNTDFAQMSAAQALFGGIGFSGKLPVSAGGFGVNTGIETQKTRLSYTLPEDAGISSQSLQNIEKIAFEGIRQQAYPGCFILVAKDGKVIYEHGFGRFEYSGTSNEVDDETVYDLASVTKAAATLPAIMKLYDEKKIRLQDNFGTFVPETKRTDKEDISIRNALFHETGITSYIPYYVSAIDENSYTGSLFGKRSAVYRAKVGKTWARTDYKFIPELVSRKSSDTFSMPVAKDMFASRNMHDVLLKDVINSKLMSKRYRYSCLNFMLLKEVVENVAKTDLNSFVQDNFYKKLGAATTTFLPLNSMSINNIPPTENDPFFRRQQLRGYVHDEGAALFGGISGNAGLFSNADDLAKLSQMWLNGGEYGGERFLSEETVSLFTKTKSGNSRRGLGFDKPDTRNSNASPASPLTPVTVYGHTGYTGTCFWIDPTNNMIYIFLSNRVFPDRLPNRLSTLKIRERIQDELYKALNSAPLKSVGGN